MKAKPNTNFVPQCTSLGPQRREVALGVTSSQIATVAMHSYEPCWRRQAATCHADGVQQHEGCNFLRKTSYKLNRLKAKLHAYAGQDFGAQPHGPTWQSCREWPLCLSWFDSHTIVTVHGKKGHGQSCHAEKGAWSKIAHRPSGLSHQECSPTETHLDHP